jgi:hypothetical protein
LTTPNVEGTGGRAAAPCRLQQSDRCRSLLVWWLCWRLIGSGRHPNPSVPRRHPAAIASQHPTLFELRLMSPEALQRRALITRQRFVVVHGQPCLNLRDIPRAARRRAHLQGAHRGKGRPNHDWSPDGTNFSPPLGGSGAAVPQRPTALRSKGLDAASLLMVDASTAKVRATSLMVSPACRRCSASWR